MPSPDRPGIEHLLIDFAGVAKFIIPGRCRQRCHSILSGEQPFPLSTRSVSYRGAATCPELEANRK